MQLPNVTIYEITPTIGMAVCNPSIEKVERESDQALSFRVSMECQPMTRDKPGDQWRLMWEKD